MSTEKYEHGLGAFVGLDAEEFPATVLLSTRGGTALSGFDEENQGE
jgi:hypothetical protein